MTQETDWYRVLGVSAQAKTSDIHRAWRALVRANHPDVGGDLDRFLTIQQAWDVLGDPVERSRFDRENRARARAAAEERLRRAHPEPSSTGATYDSPASAAWDPSTYPMTPAAAAQFRAAASAQPSPASPPPTSPAEAQRFRPPRRKLFSWVSPWAAGGMAVLPWALLACVVASFVGRFAAAVGLGAGLWGTSGSAEGTGVFSEGSGQACVLLVAISALCVLLTGAPRPKLSAAAVTVWTAVAVWLLPWLGSAGIGSPVAVLAVVSLWFGVLGAVCTAVVSARHYRSDI